MWAALRIAYSWPCCSRRRDHHESGRLVNGASPESAGRADPGLVEPPGDGVRAGGGAGGVVAGTGALSSAVSTLFRAALGSALAWLARAPAGAPAAPPAPAAAAVGRAVLERKRDWIMPETTWEPVSTDRA